jgi:hypothetical protein
MLLAGYRALFDTLSSRRGGRSPAADAWWQAPTAGRA